MARYFVGDIQGCLDELLVLLEQVNFDASQDELWLTGDLVARGPKSLETLRFVKSLGDSAKTVLGNHDLHLIATYKGIKRVKVKDRLDDLLRAPDADELINWLTHQPLLRTTGNVVMTHAGISPQWTIQQAITLATQAQAILQSSQCYDYLANMYQNTPSHWSDDLEGYARFRYIVNTLTRMRFCFADGELEFDNKCAPDECNDEKLLPWFSFNNPDWSATKIIFGHWASLMGKTSRPDIIALDTGCVWGNKMTLLHLEENTLYTTKAII
jgi:bis(5'-nucleosyl)-tetraphosphatase (symmetrical)